MVKQHEFKWSKEEDNPLLQIVLEHLKKGLSQVSAFEEAGKELGRTPAACSFHFNHYVRAKNIELINAAKDEAKQAKKQTKKKVKKQDENRVKLSLHKEVDNTETTIENDTEVNKGLLEQNSLSILESINKILEEKDTELSNLREENKRLREENDGFKNTFSLALNQLKKHNA